MVEPTKGPWRLFPHGIIGSADGTTTVAYLATFEDDCA